MRGPNTVVAAADGVESQVTFYANTDSVADINVDIPDPNLRAKIEAALGKASGDTITAADMATLTTLDASEASISDLTGLEGATNLTELYIYDNDISDISAISSLTNLTWLELDNNSISDISPVAGLTNLIRLYIYDNNISDISAVSGLTNLLSLGFSINSISDISPVAGLTNLTVLWLYDNDISDLSAVSGLTNLTQLGLGKNDISDLSAISGLTNLKGLLLDDNNISDLSTLVSNTGLGEGDYINVKGNSLNTVSINTHIPTLQGRGVEVEFDLPAHLAADANGDGTVNLLDLVLVGANLGQTGQNPADVNGDGVVNINDLILVAGAIGSPPAAPSIRPQTLEMFNAADVKLWLFEAQQIDLSDARFLRGILFLEQLLAALTPTETALLANYPNPFNPETWIPYRLAADAFVTLTIYDLSGQVVRTLEVGHQVAAFYESRSKAIYWDGRNQLGEQVASGVYYYHLSAGDYSATRKMFILK